MKRFVFCEDPFPIGLWSCGGLCFTTAVNKLSSHVRLADGAICTFPPFWFTFSWGVLRRARKHNEDRNENDRERQTSEKKKAFSCKMWSVQRF
jgi:hypothetical protein